LETILIGLSRGDLRSLQLPELTDRDGGVEQVRVRVLPDGRMTRGDAARYLGLATKTLAMWQLMGKGPRMVKVGGRVFYFRCDLDAFIRSGEGA
jgi:hypothetical protein